MPEVSKIHRFWHDHNANPTSLISLGSQYLKWMEGSGFSPRTIEERERHLRFFIRWCHERAITTPLLVTKAVLMRYQVHIYRQLQPKTSRPLCMKYQASQIYTLILFFRWLTQHNHILCNPAQTLALPKMPRCIVRNVLTHQEIKAIFALADGSDPISMRDRAVLETFYSTGMRRQELMNLCLSNVDFTHGTVMIIAGKGKKDRVVPIGNTALAWLQKYLDEVRPLFQTNPEETALFLSKDGNPLTRWAVNNLVSKYIKRANIGKTGSCHLLRHAMATGMLENGADIRYIQAILGHESLDATQIYTKVSIRKLKEVHTNTHPAKMKPARDLPTQEQNTNV